tara:strand:- start:630 stop:2513 length:1884 start_codon:yes stop_codon:yes gene_type:complete
MFTLGTAGHVDHGKSTLVQALTGMDPDRLREEKARGLTIVPGYTWLTLPSGREVSIVDVPGHAKFIKNMLTGVASIDLAILVVAANESIMPQTTEHLSILELLNIKACIPVITKADLVDPDLLELVEAEFGDLLGTSSVDYSHIVRVSSVTGAGIQGLINQIDTLLGTCSPKQDLNAPRLVVDRSFSASGYGTIVTGTLIEGKLSIGQSVELPIAKENARIRSIQSHQKAVTTVYPGQRVALNLSGVSWQSIKRGEIITTPDLFSPTNAVDAICQLLESTARPLYHNSKATFFAGAATTPCLIRLLDTDKMIAGSKAKTQIVLESKLVLARGDNFVLRRNDITIGGGIILDSHARRHKRHDQTTIRRLNTILDPTDIETFFQFLRQIVPITVSKLSKQLGLPFADLVKAISSIHSSSFASEIYILHPNNQHDAINADTILVDQPSWNRAKTTIIETVTQFHKANPSRRGIDTESLYKKIAIQRDLAIAALKDLISNKCLVLEQSSISVPNYYPSLDPLKRASAESLIQHLIKEPFSPPSLDTIEEDVVTFLIESNKVERVGGAILFESNTHKSIVSKILEEITIRGSITVGEVRDLFSTSRKFALAILEDLDQRGLTQRVGDARKLR